MDGVCVPRARIQNPFAPKNCSPPVLPKTIKTKKRLVLIPKSKFVIREKKTETPSGFFGLLNGFLNFPLAFVS
jgi:hypothetical protein